MAVSAVKPNILTDPGNLFWSPLGTALPLNTVTGGVFTDIWPSAWIQMGATSTGSDFTSTTTINPVDVAEFLDPVAYRTVSRSSTIAFQLASITATNVSRAFNGASTQVTGSAGTALTQVSPVVLGQEIRAQIGYESLDATVRIICYQVVNGGAISMKFHKAPSHTDIPWMGMMEIPASSNKPWDLFFAGTTRA
ncbi:MAG: hypothetical protein NVS3B26_16570 [Mycobacteriales bacterium]